MVIGGLIVDDIAIEKHLNSLNEYKIEFSTIAPDVVSLNTVLMRV